ncbi:MAG: hypothetical protein KZQ94_16120 [Candidatus Thiodiazotropha sp. (ex Troendleina suluensis)]|nr:hypothetical protein [Candidatus Thiodiazotropha sp. (ex Troendleina suluensis)]
MSPYEQETLYQRTGCSELESERIGDEYGAIAAIICTDYQDDVCVLIKALDNGDKQECIGDFRQLIETIRGRLNNDRAA